MMLQQMRQGSNTRAQKHREASNFYKYWMVRLSVALQVWHSLCLFSLIQGGGGSYGGRWFDLRGHLLPCTTSRRSSLATIALKEATVLGGSVCLVIEIVEISYRVAKERENFQSNLRHSSAKAGQSPSCRGPTRTRRGTGLLVWAFSAGSTFLCIRKAKLRVFISPHHSTVFGQR
jgi:hypothetical protein